MHDQALELYIRALQTAIILALPVVGAVAIVGIAIALVQTVLGIQDQNLAFGPKLIVVALMLAVWGMPGLWLLDALLRTVIMSLPSLAA